MSKHTGSFWFHPLSMFSSGKIIGYRLDPEGKKEIQTQVLSQDLIEDIAYRRQRGEENFLVKTLDGVIIWVLPYAR